MTDFRNWRAADRVQALDSLQANPAFQFLTATADKAFAEAAIAGLDPVAREQARLTCIAWRELARMVRDELTAAQSEARAA